MIGYALAALALQAIGGSSNYNWVVLGGALPQGLVLPVHLDLDVPVREPALPVSLDVRAIIPLKETQLADPIRELAGKVAVVGDDR